MTPDKKTKAHGALLLLGRWGGVARSHISLQCKEEIFLKIYSFLAVLGLHCFAWAFSNCDWGTTLRWGMRAASFVTEHRLLGMQASVVAAHRLNSCGSRALRAQAQQLWHMGLVAPQHVVSSQIRDQICVPCIGRQILIHCTTGG